ncbi:MAG: glycosyltransferase family 4 protein [Armatimonadota bacterium]
MKVIHFIDHMFCGGGQKHVLLLAEYLRKRGIESVVICSDSDDYAGEFAKQDIPVRVVPLRDFRGLCAVVRDEKADILHAHGFRHAIILSLLKPALRLPFVYTLHGYHGRAFKYNPSAAAKVKSMLRSYADKFVHRRADAVICVSEADCELVKSLGFGSPSKYSVIRNGIDCSVFRESHGSPARESLGAASDDVVITSISRFAFPKGNRYLIEAIPAVIAGHPNALFLLVGDGEDEEEMRELAFSKLRLPKDRARFLGRRTDICGILAASDVFVMPSLWEGLPIALIEAMAAGVPQVASDVDGIREVTVNGETGRLVPPMDAKKLAETLSWMIESTGKRAEYSKNSVRRANEYFDAAAMADAIAALYSDIADRKMEQKR